jgi:hypothetical protein
MKAILSLRGSLIECRNAPWHHLVMQDFHHISLLSGQESMEPVPTLIVESLCYYPDFQFDVLKYWWLRLVKFERLGESFWLHFIRPINGMSTL